MQRKPEAHKLGWRVTATTCPFATPWMQLQQDTIILPDQRETTYTYHRNAGSVCIVPLTEAGEIILVHQYRYPVDAWCWEVPAGGLSQKAPTMSMEQLAREELEEEIGGTCEEMIPITSYFPTNALSEEVCHVFLATQVRITKPQRLDPSEVIRIHPVSVREAFQRVRNGEIKDSFSALALFYCEKAIRERGYVTRA